MNYQSNRNYDIMKISFIFALIFLCFAPIPLINAAKGSDLSSKPTPIPPDFTSKVKSEITNAISSVILSEKEYVPNFYFYDTLIDQIQISEDRTWATAWITPIDTETGNPIPTEPGLVILRYEENKWQVYLPSHPEWSLLLLTIPNDLLTAEEKNNWHSINRQYAHSEAPAMTYTGYYLPWLGGETMALTQSVGHDRYTPSGNAHYAFDFATPGYPSSMFDIYAAKAGTVKQAVWTHPNGNEDHGNYLVLEDTTTSPTTYQLYLHLAQDSIPIPLRTIGAYVEQGQFIGVADDTGMSSGNHLHFHVHTYPYSYWGPSVDITFLDVPINGGRPRIPSDLNYCNDTDVCDETQTFYTSGNYGNNPSDNIPPGGKITQPDHGETVFSNTAQLSGEAWDNESGLKSVQFMGLYNNAWHFIEPVFNTSAFSTGWDLCSESVPDGPVSLALDLWDNKNNHTPNLPGLQHFIKNYKCSHVSCTPGEQQIALFAKPDFEGDCEIFDAGTFTNPSDWGNLGDNNAESILVGNSVQATLFLKDSLEGRGETFINNDSNLADNIIGANTVSSILVQPRSAPPETPVLLFPNDGTTFNDNASFSLSWENSGNDILYQSRLSINSSAVMTTSWQSSPFWHIQSLNANTYTWQVRAKNDSDTSSWSPSYNLEIEHQEPSSITYTAPFTETFENYQNIYATWTRSPYFDLTDKYNHTPNGTICWLYDINDKPENGYDTGEPNSGYFTSPNITLPSEGEFYLRFWYFYETESPGLIWDQRHVQISIDHGPFTELWQLSDDVPNTWLQSPAISLAAYKGHNVQIRFYFVTLDNHFNIYKGWFIDDFSILESPPDCGTDNNNLPSEAVPIQYNTSIDAAICPNGDIDYYQFQAQAGDQIGIRTEAQSIGSLLDTYIYLIDSDGSSIIAENDDQVYNTYTDSAIFYQIKRSGVYYIKIRSWDHPSSGGTNYNYKLHLYHEQQLPEAEFISPQDSNFIYPGDLNVQILAADSGSGISHIKLFTHPADWLGGSWELEDEQWHITNGANIIYNVSKNIQYPGMAFYAEVYDWAGNKAIIGSWNLFTPTIFLPLVNR